MRRTLVGGLAMTAAATVTYARVIRPWQQRWGATDGEVGAPLPGDEQIAEPASQITRAITIDATREEVWPWIAQIGADRGGFYSYDWLENIFRLGIHSASQIVPAWQDVGVGDLVAANRAATGGWYVVELRPHEALVLKMANMQERRPLRRDEQLMWEFLWTFALRATPSGTTRLLVRERVAFGSTLTRWLMSPIGVISFVMTRRMMLGIKERAEAQRAADERMAA